MSQPLPTNSPEVIQEEEDHQEFDLSVLKGYDAREVDQMAINYCDTMIAEDPDDAKFWTWLKKRIKGEL